MIQRVVITGMSGITSLGSDWQTIRSRMQAKTNGVRVMEEWREIKGLHTQLAAPVVDFSVPSHYTRKQTRAMGRVAKLAVVASERALEQSGLLSDKDFLSSGQVGVTYGSCSGSTPPLCDLAAIHFEKRVGRVTATTYVQSMSHTCAVNAALFFGLTGRVIPTSSACTSGSQAIGYAYEAIKYGHQTVMIAGGAEELCVSQVAVFDTLYATSQRNTQPYTTPRPFDRDRDGLVIGEGSATLILESYEHAKARGANILAEIVGFGTNCDARHITQPSSETMQAALQLALSDAKLAPSDIDFISAHGTATKTGDSAESAATLAVMGDRTPISSLKSYFGHTLGACGAIEAWLGIEMMREGLIMPTLNLDAIAEDCARLDYIQNAPRALNARCFMSNNFAFGGVNTSLIFKLNDLTA